MVFERSEKMRIQEIFKKYDIRGLFPEEINSRVAFKLGRAFGSFLGKGKKIVVGRDNRKSSALLKNSLVDGLILSGCDVIDIGLSTPDMVDWGTKSLKADERADFEINKFDEIITLLF